MRYSSLVFMILLSGVVFFGLLMLHAHLNSQYQEANLRHKAELVKQLQLTDLCLFTEARYTRHLSQADLNTAFQDHPLSMEHFPSGSFTQPNLPGITR
jgi:hypothetical protein